jgi:hypothetical protein
LRVLKAWLKKNASSGETPYAKYAKKVFPQKKQKRNVSARDSSTRRMDATVVATGISSYFSKKARAISYALGASTSSKGSLNHHLSYSSD